MAAVYLEWGHQSSQLLSHPETERAWCCWCWWMWGERNLEKPPCPWPASLSQPLGVPAVSQEVHFGWGGGGGGVCAICARGPLCTWNSTLHLGSSWVPRCNRKVSLLCYSYYLFVPFSTTVTVSPSSYYMHQVFRLPPFPQLYISPRRGFTKLSPSAFDQRLFAWFLPSDWWLTFLLV